MQPIQEEHPYVFIDGVYLKRNWGGEIQNVSVLVAIGVNSEGYREILGVAEGSREGKESWSNFFRYLKERGLNGVKLVISDKASVLVEHWRKIRTNNGLERIMKEIRRRTRVVGSFPDGYSAMMLVGARLRHISTTKWGTRQYLACKMESW